MFCICNFLEICPTIVYFVRGGPIEKSIGIVCQGRAGADMIALCLQHWRIGLPIGLLMLTFNWIFILVYSSMLYT